MITAVAAPDASVGPESVNFAQTPFVAIWETTRACDLACRHCQAEASPGGLRGALTTKEGLRLLDALVNMGTPNCVLSGGDPAKRPDLCRLVGHGSRLGIRMTTIPAPTPRLNRQLVRNLMEAGLAQIALNLDGPTPDVHDSFRGVSGAFDITLRGIQYAGDEGLPLQINTLFGARNWECFDAMADLVRSLGVESWEVFFLVPLGRGAELGRMSVWQFENLFARLSRFAQDVDFIIKVSEAPHYRRFLIQQATRAAERTAGRRHEEFPFADLPSHMRRDFGLGDRSGLAPQGVNSGKGQLFINYRGDICPGNFLPVVCGNIRRHSLAEVYRRHAVFQDLRNPDLLKGKCGMCEFRGVCGGSRARAFACSGDYLEHEPCCLYRPV